MFSSSLKDVLCTVPVSSSSVPVIVNSVVEKSPSTASLAAEPKRKRPRIDSTTVESVRCLWRLCEYGFSM